MTSSEVAERLHMPQTTVSDLVSRAESTGLVRREPSEVDGRSAYLSLTDEGDLRLGICMAALEDDREELELALTAATSRMRSMGLPS
jgi:DNA-binding MarR family transcriptional regulator